MSSKAMKTEFEHARFKGAVERWLRDHEGMLIEEVVPIVTNALKRNDISQGIYDHVIIDEYQDLTKCEQEMVELIWSGEGSLVVLGDDDQSIYSFRYNHPEGIKGFKKKHNEIEDIKIPENWRSGRDIVNVANIMMEEAGSDKEPMKPQNDFNGNTNLIFWRSVEEEINGLTEYIKKYDEQDFLVLVPRKFIGYKLRDAIGEEARTEFNQEVLQHCIIQERFTLGNLVANPNNKVALRTWYGFRHDDSKYANGRNCDAYNKLRDNNNLNLELVKGISEEDINLKGKGQKNINLRSQRLIKLLDIVPKGIKEKIEFLFGKHLFEITEEKYEKEKANLIKNDLNRLYSCAMEIKKRNKDISLSKVLRKLRYRIVTRAPLIEEKENSRIRIMTLHSAKGLESDVIILAGIADQMIPGKSSNIEEQRRLLYVAITRAKKDLVISWPQKVSMKKAKSNYIKVEKDNIYWDRDQDNLYVRLSLTNLLPNGAIDINRGDQLL